MCAFNFASGIEDFSVGYTTGASLGNFDEIIGLATAAVTGKTDNYSMGRDATRKLQSDLQQNYPYIYGGAEFAGAMTTPMHLVKDNTFVNKSFNALSDTISASAGYANNLDDFKTNLVANGIANIIGLKMEKLPFGKAYNSNTGKKLAAKGCKFAKQGINSLTDKLKTLYYNDEE